MDETLKLDFRSRGNETSVFSLMEEVIYIILGRDGSHRTLGGLRSSS